MHAGTGTAAAALLWGGEAGGGLHNVLGWLGTSLEHLDGPDKSQALQLMMQR
jgi:hypothetical protein